nr:MAG TPA: L1 Poxvirus entry protein complex L1 and I2 [Caudoviricetes sp.]
MLSAERDFHPNFHAVVSRLPRNNVPKAPQKRSKCIIFAHFYLILIIFLLFLLYFIYFYNRLFYSGILHKTIAFTSPWVYNKV